MLENTFCHLPGIGLIRERRLWECGFGSWDDCLLGSQPAAVSQSLFNTMLPGLAASQRALELQDAEFFATGLPKSELWRLFPTFRRSTAYIDIETTGRGVDSDHITTVALYDGETVRTYVHGQNLESFADHIGSYSVIVTFNGRCFDVPILERELQIRLPRAHIDLRFLLKDLGYRGGLKRLERTFGLDRGGLDGFDGYTAVLLWEAFERSGDERTLETLLAYNAEDVLNLEHLLVSAINLKLESLPLSKPPLPTALPGSNPHRADRRTLEAILSAQRSR